MAGFVGTVDAFGRVPVVGRLVAGFDAPPGLAIGAVFVKVVVVVFFASVDPTPLLNGLRATPVVDVVVDVFFSVDVRAAAVVVVATLGLAIGAVAGLVTVL